MILLWTGYLFGAKCLKLWPVTSSVSEGAEKGGAWEGTELVQCFSIRNSFIIKISEGKRGLWFHHARCQARVSASFSLLLGSKMSVVCRAEVSLQLSTSIPIRFVASQQREKIHPSFPLLSAAQMVATADCSRVPLVGCPPSPRRPTEVEVGGAGPRDTQDEVSEVVHHPVQLQNPVFPLKSMGWTATFCHKNNPSSFIRTHIWFCSIPRHPNQLFQMWFFSLSLSPHYHN